ncbi:MULTISPECIES: nucleotide triphosphate diphosphatase NUDT15 [unclassified Pseudoalteromonas]|uniref:nucleotide triphosphate diphosphatase NUDT15 n=1 Tax=unclassified Pseudoalteromonas TaxID=194690 RepID=UPI0030144854
MNEAVRVGVAVVIIREQKILLGERIGAHGANTWATPGGHLEFGEEIAECAKREVQEETGLTVTEVTRLGFSNDIFAAENKHYITLFVAAKVASGEAQVLEPNKCLHWRWFDLAQLPQPLFLSLANFLAKDKTLLQQL